MIEFLIGLCSYILAGMGLGGGILLIPLLTEVLNVNQLNAQYISLIAYIPAGIILIILSKNNKLFYKILPLIPLGLFGAIAGAYVSQKVDIEFLRKIYGAFLVVFGISLCIKTLSKDKKTVKFTDFR